MHRFHIHLITDRKSARADLFGTVGGALRGGVNWVQVREKTGPARDLYETALRIIPLARENGAGVMINDRIDVALATGAGGVHLAGKSLPPWVAESCSRIASSGLPYTTSMRRARPWTVAWTT